jgi:hypothetical protein
MGPNGYSAVGGQTYPYGRKIFDTGGSSSGSGAWQLIMQQRQWEQKLQDYSFSSWQNSLLV